MKSNKKQPPKNTKNTPKKTLPANLQEKKNLVILKNEAPINTRNLYYSGAYKQLGVDNSFSMQDFQENFKIHLISCDDTNLVFEMIGVDAPIANALRRILIAEVPTMAIEKVYITNNTSIMQDEVLAHRLGLIPIKADPRKFIFRNKDSPDYHSNETIVFKLDIKCTRNPKPKDDSDEQKYINSVVRSGDLEFVAQHDQEQVLGAIRPVHEDIIIAKLRPGQEIQLKAFCEKGVGKDHAKFSPVSTASYRLFPQITFHPSKDPKATVKEILDADAQELVNLCPMKVFDIEDLGNGHKQPVVARPLACTMCRECIRPAKFNDKITLGRVKNHFIFSVESTGILPPRVLFREAVQELMTKCTTFEKQLQKIANNDLF